MDKVAILRIEHSQPRPIEVEEAIGYIKRALRGELEEKAEVIALAQQIANSLPALGRRLAIALSKTITEEEAESLAKALGLRFLKDEEGYRLHVVDYLKAKPPEKAYKLFYNPPERGWVLLERKRFRRVVEGAFFKALIGKKPIDAGREQLLPLLPKERKVTVKVKEHPPCIEKILAELKAGINLSHYARWVLAVYLYNIGMDKEEIIELYKSLPDFKEKVTRYHVEYIFKKGYSMPSCEKIKGYGLCVKDCGVKNPMELVRGHGGKRKGMDKG